MKNKYFTRVDVRLGYDLTLYLPLYALPVVNGAEGEPKAFDASDVDITDVRMQGVGETGKGKPVRFETLYNYIIVHAPKQTKKGDARIWVEGTYGQVCINAEIVATIAKNDGEIVKFLDPYVSPIVGDCAWVKGVAPMPIKFTNIGDIPTGVGMMVMGENMPNLQVSTDGEEWRDVTEEEFNTMPFTLNPDASIYFRGNNPNGLSTENSVKPFAFSEPTAEVSVSGDPMSLINAESRVAIVPDGSSFTGLFADVMEAGGTPIVDASGLVLFDIVTTNSCFYYLFSGCTKLVSIPDIVLRKAGTAVLQEAFVGCPIHSAGVIYAREMAAGCFYEIFKQNPYITSVKSLPSTNLAESCYENMFFYCESLSIVPDELPATVLAESCYSSMFSGCTSLVNAPALPATVLAESCYFGMFGDCTSLTKAPALPAMVLAESCYSSMFSGCTSLVNAPALPATVLAESCYKNMFGSIDGGCISMTKAPELPATVLASNCYGQMFYGCTSLAKAPALHATVLATNCYYEMFTNCSKLAHIEMMALAIPTAATHNWVKGVAASGTFVKNKNATWEYVGVNGVPAGWEVIKK